MIQVTPYGWGLSALDLGSDFNRAVHGEEGAWLDTALDAVSLFPTIKRPGLKTIRPLGRLGKILQNNRKAINVGVNSGKFVDFINDSHLKDSKGNPLIEVFLK